MNPNLDQYCCSFPQEGAPYDPASDLDSQSKAGTEIVFILKNIRTTRLGN